MVRLNSESQNEFRTCFFKLSVSAKTSWPVQARFEAGNENYNFQLFLNNHGVVDFRAELKFMSEQTVEFYVNNL